jgi:hypothetical protein
MMNVIASEHKIGSLFWEVASCFYERELDLEEIFCFPFSEVRSGSSIGALYFSMACNDSLLELKMVIQKHHTP